MFMSNRTRRRKRSARDQGIFPVAPIFRRQLSRLPSPCNRREPDREERFPALRRPMPTSASSS